MNFLSQEPEEHHLNLTPLIDVVFLLLIFFLSATTFQRNEVEMDLDLPTAASGEAGSDASTLVIQVASNGDLSCDGRRVTVEALRQKLKAAASRENVPEVRIRGDKRSQFGLVAEVLDACMLAKLSAISIVAEPEQGSGR